jgi:hypothetical protein
MSCNCGKTSSGDVITTFSDITVEGQSQLNGPTIIGGNQAIRIFYSSGIMLGVNTDQSVPFPAGVTASNIISVSASVFDSGPYGVTNEYGGVNTGAMQDDPYFFSLYWSATEMHLQILITGTGVANKAFKLIYFCLYFIFRPNIIPYIRFI